MTRVNANADTQPVRAVSKRGSRPFGCLTAAVLTLAVPVFLCGLAAVIYLLLPPAPTTVLVLGIDSRPGEGWQTRADSIMLAGIDPARLRVSLLSIPRDLSVETPGYGWQRINVAHALGEMERDGGGPELLASAVGHSFGVKVDRFVRLDFDGFVKLINAVGGVTIDVERRIEDFNYPTEDYGVQTVRFEPGVQHMDGDRALKYARTRYADDDYRRAERQQQVLSALLGKLVNPVYWAPALAAMGQALDTNLTLWDLAVLAPTVLVNRGQFDRLVIDRDYITANAAGAAVPNYAKLEPWLRERFRR